MRMVVEEADLVVLPHEYGYCVYRGEVARFGGVWARVGLSTCVSCSNFAVAPAHVPLWKRRQHDSEHLLADLESMPGRETAAAAVCDMLAETEAVLARIRSVGNPL